MPWLVNAMQWMREMCLALIGEVKGKFADDLRLAPEIWLRVVERVHLGII